MKSLIVALSVVALSACKADVKAPQNVQLLEYGTFKKLAVHDDVRAPDAIAGARHAVSKVALLECTTNVPASVGTSFGFRVMMPGKPSGDVVPCTAKCLHPRLTDPSSGRSSEVEGATVSQPPRI